MMAFDQVGKFAEDPRMQTEFELIADPVFNRRKPFVFQTGKECFADFFRQRAGQGTVHVVAKPKLASKDGFNKRSSPQSILRHAVSGGKTTNSTSSGGSSSVGIPGTKASTTPVSRSRIAGAQSRYGRLKLAR